MDKEEFLSVLLTSTEEQQHAISKAIKEFERQNRELSASVPRLKRVVQDSIAESMTDTAQTAKTAIDDALKPLLQSLVCDIEKASDRAAEEKKQLNRTLALLSWKWLAIASMTTASVGCVLLFAIYSAVWWQRHELESLQEDKAAMEENIAELRKHKGEVHFSLCGKSQRPCVEVENDRAYGEDEKHPFYILKGIK